MVMTEDCTGPYVDFGAVQCVTENKVRAFYNPSGTPTCNSSGG